MLMVTDTTFLIRQFSPKYRVLADSVATLACLFFCYAQQNDVKQPKYRCTTASFTGIREGGSHMSLRHPTTTHTYFCIHFLTYKDQMRIPKSAGFRLKAAPETCLR
jgi:hypothetical protein